MRRAIICGVLLTDTPHIHTYIHKPHKLQTHTTHLQADVQVVAGAVHQGEQGRGEEPHREEEHHVLQHEEGLVEAEGPVAELVGGRALPKWGDDGMNR